MKHPVSYNIAAIVLHWLVVLLIAVTFPIAWIMVDMKDDSPAQLSWFAVHISIGISILLLVTLRLINRLFSGAPAAPADTPVVMQKLTGLIHLGLYALLFIVPFTGWVMASAGGNAVSFFGIFSLPDLVVKDDGLHETTQSLHETVAYILLGLIALHTTAALKHQFVQRDDVLARMLPFLRKR
jgi:cytochrome b561